MKKQIRISQNLKNLIEDYIKFQAKTAAMMKETEAMKAMVTQINQRENRVNIYWFFDDRGKIKKIFWNEGLSVKEKQEFEEQNAWSLEQLAKNMSPKL